MNKYLVLYNSPASAAEQMANATPEQAKAGMDAWMAWAQKSGEAVVDLGMPLGDGRQKDILRRRQAVHCRGVVLGQVVGIKPGRIQSLNLHEPQGIDVLKVETWHRFNVVENTKL